MRKTVLFVALCLAGWSSNAQSPGSALSIDSADPGDCALELQPARQRATNRTVFRMTTHFTATVTLAWLVTTPIVIETGTAPPGVTDSGISAFSCTRPAVASGASPQ